MIVLPCHGDTIIHSTLYTRHRPDGNWGSTVTSSQGRGVEDGYLQHSFSYHPPYYASTLCLTFENDVRCHTVPIPTKYTREPLYSAVAGA